MYKWKSRRWLLALWAVAISSFIMIFSITTQYTADWIGIALPLLLAIPSAYIFGDSYTKKKLE